MNPKEAAELTNPRTSRTGPLNQQGRAPNLAEFEMSISEKIPSVSLIRDLRPITVGVSLSPKSLKEESQKKMNKLVVGLGNPGIRYAKTRHNVGFMVLDAIAKDRQVKFSRSKKTECSIAKMDEIILAKPHTFMNNSGRAIAKLINYFRVDRGNVLVIYDDVDLPLGAIRFRESGSSAGHKGMQSIIDALATGNIRRIRIGVGKKPHIETDRYVLQNFSSDELKQLKTAVSEAARLAMDKI